MHYGRKILGEIYGLSRSDFQEHSLARRASYDYLNQIVESSHAVLGERLEMRGVRPEDSYIGLASNSLEGMT